MADYYRIQDYEGYIWLAHNRYATNRPELWERPDPFNLHDWSVVENGKTTTYGANRRYVESFGYNCSTGTDSEVIAYLIDLLVRKHGLDISLAIRALAPPYWEEIDRMPEAEQNLNRALRFAYGSATMNGPFTVVAANPDMMVGFTDRGGKLRPMVVGECGDRLYIASEEAAIRAMESGVESIARPAAGEPVIGRVAPMSSNLGSMPLRYRVTIDREQCMECERCIENCSYGVFRRDGDRILINSRKCTACHRCLAYCPRDAIMLEEQPCDYRSHPVWTRAVRESIYNQARTGKIILAGMGSVANLPIIFDHLMLDACQVTTPPTDPLREPVELRTYLGKKPSKLEFRQKPNGDVELSTELTPNLMLETPIMLGHMSYGAISLNAHVAMARAARETGTYMGTGEGGLHPGLYPLPGPDDRPGRVRAVRRERRLPGARRRDRTQTRPGSKTGHRRAPHRREGECGRLQDKDDPAG